MVWKWRKQVMDGTVEGTFEFQPQLTSEPTAPEPQERYTFVFDGYANTGDDGSIDDLAVDPPAVQKGAWFMDATFQGGVTVATEHFILQGDQCLVF